MSQLAVVFDPAFCERLIPLANQMHVWVVESELNRPYIDQWAKSPNHLPQSGLSIFDGATFDAAFIEMVLDHCEDDDAPQSLETIHLYGLEPSPTQLAMLAEYGIGTVKHTDDQVHLLLHD